MDVKRYAAEQYDTSERLERRISIHEKYSVNQQGFGSWIAAHYALRPGMRILELGCGTGEMWKSEWRRLEGSRLLLSDLSPGMIETARRNLSGVPQIEFQVIDIQQIPFEDVSFDSVIANMMLYHVPDIPTALTEVRRVLKPNGIFYCATYGENGMIDYLFRRLPRLKKGSQTNNAFTLQNGAGLLKRHFGHVERDLYPDELRVTNLDDLVDYIYSLSSMTGLTPEDRGDLRSDLEALAENGVLTIPKEYGLFMSW